MVGPWSQVDGDLAAQALERGPRASGVYARFSADGRTLTLLDQDGRRAQTLGAGAGLIAATASGEEAPVWVVTGPTPRASSSPPTRSTRARSRTASPWRSRRPVAVAVPEAGAVKSMGTDPLFYRRMASPLHATRAGVGAAWALALTAATLLLFHPLAAAGAARGACSQRGPAPAWAASSRARCGPR